MAFMGAGTKGGSETDAEGDGEGDGDGGETAPESDPEGETGGDGDEETVAGLQAVLGRVQAALKKANREAASRRKKLDKFEAEEETRRKADLSELEKAQEDLAAAKAERERLATVMERDRIRYAVEMAAAGLEFQSPADAFNLADLSSVEVTEDGEVTGVAEALKALAKEKPYLIKAENGGPGTPPSKKKKTNSRGSREKSRTRFKPRL